MRSSILCIDRISSRFSSIVHLCFEPCDTKTILRCLMSDRCGLMMFKSRRIDILCWKRDTYAHMYEHTYAHTYISTISYFRFDRSDLTLEVFIRSLTSFFIKYALSYMLYLLNSSINISTCTYSFWFSYINRLWAQVSFISLSQTNLRTEFEALNSLVMIVSLTTQDIYRDQTVITITRLEIWR